MNVWVIDIATMKTTRGIAKSVGVRDKTESESAATRLI